MDSKQIIQAYSSLQGLRDQENRKYSETGIKRTLAKEGGLRVSDIDRALYGREIFTDNKLTGEQKANLASSYNARDKSLRELAQEFGVSRDYIYKVLYEMENQGNAINWRGAPKNFGKRTQPEVAKEPAVNQSYKLEEIPIPSEVWDIKGLEKRVEMPASFQKPAVKVHEKYSAEEIKLRVDKEAEVMELKRKLENMDRRSRSPFGQMLSGLKAGLVSMVATALPTVIINYSSISELVSEKVRSFF